jgi:hypothetical protein
MMEYTYEVTNIDITKQGNEWNELISSSYQGTFFHTSYWINLIAKSFDLKSHQILLKYNEKPVLAMPLFSSKSALHSPFIGDYGGVCINQDYTDNIPLLKDAFACIYKKIIKIGKNESVPIIYVRGFYNNKFQDEFLTNMNFSSIMEHVTYVLSKHCDVEDIMGILHKNTRQAVKKAIKAGLIVKSIPSDSTLMKRFFELHGLTKEKHASEPLPKEFFELLPTIPKDNIHILLAKHNDIYIAGLLAFSYNNRMHIFDSCSDPEYLKLNPNNLLYFSLIELAREKRMEVDFGRTSLEHDSLRRFKKRWGGEMYSYGTFRNILPPVLFNIFRLGVSSIKSYGIKGTINKINRRRTMDEGTR